MALFKAHSTGATFFARNYSQLQQLASVLPPVESPRVAWVVGVGGGDEVELGGKRYNTGSVKLRQLKTISGLNAGVGPMTPIEHHELACQLSRTGPFEMHVLEVSPANLKVAQAGVTQEQRRWVERNITDPSMVVGNPLIRGRSPAGLQDYAREFHDFINGPKMGAAAASTHYYLADATRNHPPTQPPDVVVCHNAFIHLNSAAKLEPLLKALKVGGILSIGNHEQPGFILNPRQRIRYGLRKLGPRIFQKTKGPVEQLPPAKPVLGRVAPLRPKNSGGGGRRSGRR